MSDVTCHFNVCSFLQNFMFISTFTKTSWNKSCIGIFKKIIAYRNLPKFPNYNKYCYQLNKPVLFLLPCGQLIEEKPQNSITLNDVEENVSHLMAIARIALEQGDTDRATAILEMGIKICEEYGSYASLPFIYDTLASISFALGNMTDAEQIIVKSMEKLIQIGMQDTDSQMIDFQLRLSRIYSSYEENHLAEIGFKDCLNKQLEKIANGDTSTKTGMLYVNVLFWYGLHKMRNFKPSVAKELIFSAYSYSSKIKGLSPYQEMVILYTLGELRMQLGDSNAALQNMNSAIMLGKSIGSTDMPQCYLKLAQIYYNLGAWNNAKIACLEALKLATLFNHTNIEIEAENTLEKIYEKIN